MGFDLADCVLYDPHKPGGGLTAEQLREARMVLWRGHCSVHGRFTLDCLTEVRQRVPGVNVLVHPECRYGVVTAADYIGSTEKIIKTIAEAPAGSAWAVGTGIDLPHLVWALEELAAGRPVNQITVDPATTQHTRAALDQMLACRSREVAVPCGGQRGR